MVLRQRLFVSCLLPLLASIVGGCAQQRTTASGFLGESPVLQKTGRGDDLGYVRSDVEWGGYYEVVIDPVAVVPARGERLRVTDKEAEELRIYVRKTLAEVLGKRFEITTEPGPGALRVRAALTEVGQAAPWINIPAAIVAYPVDYGGATIEVEVLDYGTSQRLVALKASRTGDLSLLLEHFTSLGHARAGIERSADRLRLMIDQAVATSAESQRLTLAASAVQGGHGKHTRGTEKGAQGVSQAVERDPARRGFAAGIRPDRLGQE